MAMADVMAAAEAEGRQLDRASVAFTLGFCAGVRSRPRTIAEAEEGLLAVGDGIQLWFRCWGNRAGTPVLFVHGGPGNCVADYRDINAKFFDHRKFWVVEVDQRGTGQSQPSVREDFRHMQRYLDISISQ